MLFRKLPTKTVRLQIQKLGKFANCCWLLFIYANVKFNKSSAVAQTGDHWATIDMGRKEGGCWAPCNTMWLGPRPTLVPSFILIHPTVWPQYTNVTDSTDRQTMV